MVALLHTKSQPDCRRGGVVGERVQCASNQGFINKTYLIDDKEV